MLIIFTVIHNIHALSTDTHPDAFPNTMTPADPVLSLVDAGFAINAGFPPLVRSHRHVDFILSLNYSWEQDQFKVRTWKVLRVLIEIQISGTFKRNCFFKYACLSNRS